MNFNPVFGLRNRRWGLKRFSSLFSETNRSFVEKNYIAFVHLLKPTSLQNKNDFDFLSLATNRRFWSIFAWIRSYNFSSEVILFIKNLFIKTSICQVVATGVLVRLYANFTIASNFS